MVRALPRRPARAGDRAAAAGARAARSCRSPSRGRPRSTRVDAAGAADLAAPLPHAAHALSARALPLERPLHRDRHQRRRRRELLPRARRHAAARGRDPRSRAASSSTCATCASGAVWSADATSRRAASRTTTVVTFLPEKARLPSGATTSIETQLEIAVSPEDDVEVRRVSLTNRSDRAARDRGDELRRDRARRRRPTTSRTRRSASCSSRPSAARRRRRSCAAPPAARGGRPGARGRSTC